MQEVLVIGAGRSASVLIDYLLDLAEQGLCRVKVADMDIDLATKQVKGSSHAEACTLDIFDLPSLETLISHSDVVVSMVPASFHIHVAKVCASKGKHMITASYLSDEIKALAPEFEANNASLIMELGLDPGIDHMSAMKVLDQIRDAGHTLTSFETFTGGLLAPSEEDNPWEYKFTWNPRNVVLAGQGVVKFLQEGRYKYIPYHRVFRRTEIVHIPGHGYFEGYANRDSLKYLKHYDLEGIRTLYRGTFRRVGFCKAWDVFVQLGATDDSYQMENVGEMSHRQFINSFLAYNPDDSVELKLAHYLNLELESEIMYKLKWVGIFSDEKVGLDKGTPAQILEHILKKKWSIQEEDKDMIVMWHKFDYLEKGVPKQIQSHMVVEGENQRLTAMAKTVGLPIAIAVKKLLDGSIRLSGIHLPIQKEIYEPLLDELAEHGIQFTERKIKIKDANKKELKA